MTAKTMSQKEYAAHRNVSQPYICKMKKQGRLVMRGNRVDVAASDANMNAESFSIQPVGGTYAQAKEPQQPAAPSRQPADAGGVSFAQARTMREAFQAKLARLKYEEQRGELIRTEEVAQLWSDQIQAAKSKLLAIPNRAAPMVAGLTDAGEVRELLAELVRESLSELYEDGRRSTGITDE